MTERVQGTVFFNFPESSEFGWPFADLELLKMLTQLEPLKRHQDVKLPRSQGTGLWLLNLESFIEWQNTNTNTITNTGEESGHVFCCYGIPGAGKTVIRYVTKYSMNIPVMSWTRQIRALSGTNPTQQFTTPPIVLVIAYIVTYIVTFIVSCFVSLIVSPIVSLIVTLIVSPIVSLLSRTAIVS